MFYSWISNNSVVKIHPIPTIVKTKPFRNFGAEFPLLPRNASERDWQKAGKRLNASPVKLSFLDEGMH